MPPINQAEESEFLQKDGLFKIIKDTKLEAEVEGVSAACPRVSGQKELHVSLVCSTTDGGRPGD